MYQSEGNNLVANVVHTIPTPAEIERQLARKGGGVVLYFDYRINSGEEPYQEVIAIDLSEPITLVVTEERRNVYHISIVAYGEKLEWTVDEIVSLKFGYTREIV